jgi:hypothetical protein
LAEERAVVVAVGAAVVVVVGATVVVVVGATVVVEATVVVVGATVVVVAAVVAVTGAAVVVVALVGRRLVWWNAMAAAAGEAASADIVRAIAPTANFLWVIFRRSCPVAPI